MFTYTGFDADRDPIKFVLLDDTVPFSIPQTGSGDVAVAVPALDFERKTQYILDKIYVTEFGFNPIPFGNKCGPLTVNVLPVNEFTPVFDPSYQNSTLPEGLLQNSLLAKLNCSDEDKEPDGSPFGCSSITIQTGNDIIPKFTIVNNAVVTTNNVIDFDTGDVIYTLVIVGVDSSTRDPRKTGTMTIKVNIEPVNEFTPVIHDQPLCTNISNATPLGNEIFSINATDDDAPPHGNLSYMITDGNEKGIFRVCEKTGKIHLDRSVASAAGTTFTLTVKVTDGDFCSSAVLKILITSSC
uniref:Cadherin domain-containing protein n=1 Tax=Magallana gigas TaxID=29159 RepID=A0A8W8LIR2_MAGGI|nr:protocadherin-23 [Crassostrea gigas]